MKTVEDRMKTIMVDGQMENSGMWSCNIWLQENTNCPTNQIVALTKFCDRAGVCEVGIRLDGWHMEWKILCLLPHSQLENLSLFIGVTLRSSLKTCNINKNMTVVCKKVSKNLKAVNRETLDHKSQLTSHKQVNQGYHNTK